MTTIYPVQGDLLAGVAAQSSDTIAAPAVSLFSGDSPDPVAALYPAAGGTAFVAGQVVGFDGAGQIVPAEYASVAGVKATGTLTFSGVGTDADTITVGGRVYTLVAALTGAEDEVLIGASATDTAQAFKNAINGDSATLGVTHGSTTDHPSVVASGAAAAITLTAKEAGAAGNSVTTTESGTGTSFGGAVLSGGSDAKQTAVQAIGVVAYATSGTPVQGDMIGVYRAGCFNPDRLTYDASYSTDTLKRMAFEGAPTPTNIIVVKPAAMTI